MSEDFTKNEDFLGSHDEDQLSELGSTDAYGGTTTAPCVRTVVKVSLEVCPTTACTSRC